MSEETKVFESELNGGVKYEIHVSQGFSGRSEIAIKIEEEVVSVLSVEVKRSGNVFCRPAKTRAILIKKEAEECQSPRKLNLDDVMNDNNLEDIEIENKEL